MKRFDKIRTKQGAGGLYPYIYDLRYLRISQLNNKHIERIYTFKDRLKCN